MSAELDILKEMGFSEERAKKALELSGNQGVESAMEWLLAHGEESMDISEPAREPTNASGPATLVLGATTERGDSRAQIAEKQEEPLTEPEQTQLPPPMAVASQEPTVPTDGTTADGTTADGTTPTAAKSLKCDECGKKFRTGPEVEFHAVKSGHQSFSESVEDVKPLTEEEKLEQKQKLEDKIRQRRQERAEKEKREAVEREKERRKMGQEIATTRQKIEEEEMRKLAEQRRREKMEDKLARQKILEEIERDKLARREMFNMEPPAGSCEPSPAAVASPPPQEITAVKKDYTECKLQIRLTNGQTLTQTFGAHEELAAVRLYVELNRTDGEQPFLLMTSFPRKVFSEEDYVKPLSALGLVPSAVIILSKKK